MRLFRPRRPENPSAEPTVTVVDLKRLLDRGEGVVLLDVRQPSAYAEYPGAIPGSIRIAPADLPTRYGELPRGRPIVPYCT